MQARLTIGVWLHPWDLVDTGAPKLLSELKRLGYNSVSMCARYVEERQCWPGPCILYGNPRRRTYLSEEGRAYWTPDPRYYEGLPEELKPQPSSEVKGDILSEYLEACKSTGVHCAVWLPLLRNEYAVRRRPDLAAVDAWGTIADYKRHFMCPNNPMVRRYVRALVEELSSRYEVAELELDYTRYPEPPVTSAPPHYLMAVAPCFCKYCRERMRENGIDPDKLVHKLEALIDSLASILSRHPYHPEEGDYDYTRSMFMDLLYQAIGDTMLSRWLRLRAELIAELVAEVREVLRAYNANAILSLDAYPPTTSWLLGQDYTMLSKHLDTFKIMMYTRPFKVSPWRIPVEVQIARRRAPNTRIVVGVAGWPPTRPQDVERDVSLALGAEADGVYLYSYGWTPRRILEQLPRQVEGLMKGG